jgi:hypothetical protein
MSLHAICNENVIITLPKEVNKVVDLLNNKNNHNIPIKNGKITLPLTAGQSKWLLFSK